MRGEIICLYFCNSFSTIFLFETSTEKPITPVIFPFGSVLGSYAFEAISSR
jgi:hypothetical protein